MTEEEKRQLMKNCYDGLDMLDGILNSLLLEDNFNKDDKLLNMKNEIKNNMDKLDSMIGDLSNENN